MDEKPKQINEGSPSIDQLTGGPKPTVKTRSQADIDAEASMIRLETEKLNH